MPDHRILEITKTREEILKERGERCYSVMKTVAANIDNDRLSDAEFRQFVRNSTPGFCHKPLKEV